MMDLDKLLKERINITPEMEKKAEDIYDETSEYLLESLEEYSPDIFSQGSFRLKTIIRPIDNKDEFDLDFVCLLDIDKSDTKNEWERHNRSQGKWVHRSPRGWRESPTHQRVDHPNR